MDNDTVEVEQTPECSDAWSPIEQDGEDGQQCTGQFCQVFIKEEPHFEQVTEECLEDADCNTENDKLDILPSICSTTGQINATEMVTDGSTALSLIDDEDDDCDQQPADQFFEVLIKQETHWEQGAEDGSEEQNFSILSSGIQNLEKDVTKHTREKRFKCDHCDYKALHKSHFIVHLRTHTKEKPFSCEFCNYAGADAGRLRVHMRKHTGEKPYSCEICDFKCSQLSNLKGHRRTHSDKKHFSCELCDYTCTRSCRLKNHLYRKHNVGVERFSCEFCEYSSLQSTDLKLHLRTHSGEKPFSCEFCAFKCSRLGNLTAHLKTHTGEKPFICELCDFASAYSSALQRHHVRHHKGKNPVSCKFCAYTCSKPSDLKEHLRTQHKDEDTFNQGTQNT